MIAVYSLNAAVTYGRFPPHPVGEKGQFLLALYDILYVQAVNELSFS